MFFEGPLIVAGPCALEDDELNLRIAGALAELRALLGVRIAFKGSFDKANRTRIDADRGPGLEAGLRSLERVRSETGLEVLTDVHDVSQVEPAAAVVDALQVPAFLCRQTDLLVRVGETGLPVNVKKGQWMAPGGMVHAVEKVRAGGSNDLAVTERGTFFGYGDLVVDMRSFELMRETTGATVLFDVTHSVQQPGKGVGGRSGGVREAAPALARAACAAGAHGLYLETHPDPKNAPSDPDTMWPLERLRDLIEPCLELMKKFGF